LNKKLVLGKNIRLEFDVQKRDKYNRLLAYVWSDGFLVNEELVKEGLAVSETIQPNVKYQDRILKAQQEARKNCRGIWEGLCQKNESSKNKSCIRIVRIHANAPGDDNKNKNGEWIELKNFCDHKISLDGWFLKDNSSDNVYIFEDFSLEKGQKVRIYSGCGQNSKRELYWQCPEKEYAVWNNSGDHAFLFDNQGKIVDDYSY
jgi:micrococcal nuclease